MNNDEIVVIDEFNNQITMNVLFTFEDPRSRIEYVYYYNPEKEEDGVYVSRYAEDGSLSEPETDEEWEMLDEVFEAFMFNDEEDDEGEEEVVGN